jgi:hypothetical protein
MGTYLSHFCNYIETTYATSLTTNHVLPHGNTFVTKPTNDRVHQKVPHASMIIIRLGFHILPLHCTYDYGILLHVTNNPMTNMKPHAPTPRLCHVAHKLSLCLSY